MENVTSDNPLKGHLKALLAHAGQVPSGLSWTARDMDEHSHGYDAADAYEDADHNEALLEDTHSIWKKGTVMSGLLGLFIYLYCDLRYHSRVVHNKLSHRMKHNIKETNSKNESITEFFKAIKAP